MFPLFPKQNLCQLKNFEVMLVKVLICLEFRRNP